MSQEDGILDAAPHKYWACPRPQDSLLLCSLLVLLVLVAHEMALRQFPWPRGSQSEQSRKKGKGSPPPVTPVPYSKKCPDAPLHIPLVNAAQDWVLLLLLLRRGPRRQISGCLDPETEVGSGKREVSGF